MNTIAIISQKRGGAGKTTVALHLAVSSTRAGRNTAIIDLDPQASAASWGDRREAALPVVLSAHASRLSRRFSKKRLMDCLRHTVRPPESVARDGTQAGRP